MSVATPDLNAMRSPVTATAPDIWLQPTEADQLSRPSALRRMTCGSRLPGATLTGSPASERIFQ